MFFYPVHLRAYVFLFTASLFVPLGCTQQAPPSDGDAIDVPSATAGDASEVIRFGLDQFSIFPAEDDSWAAGDDVESNLITCAGKTKGYIYTNEAFGEGTVEFDYRYPTGLAADVIPNTGLLLLIEPPHKKWPRCLEAQGKQSEVGQLKGNGGVDGLEPKFLLDEAELEQTVRGPGEWNSVRVVIGGSGVVAFWNGTKTAECGLGGLSSGPFGLQSEGNPVEFRNIRFTPAK